MQSFVEIGVPVLETKMFEGITMHGHDGRLDHVTWIIYIPIGSPY